ncbi:hypothetical protein EYZ11_001077 [Aspergillus tanneri]|uniref:Uncharacterized protein n=1 Tax=Aspergillus tanneri TaxID=1220188 RepID=A0A4S3JVH2_9EURO|nr:uncharacterized protein ATNIH1004_009705 [Aspergillus tanneri]KAA8642944.1 hypothetical protein ATNIH1004_009705 [Aspergillus tanneri]THC99439.1 hypothetical protein EYZ11_001077 [Aspergillus tanneri]
MALLFAGLSLLGTAVAKSVSIVPLEGGCAALPGYDASRGIAGPWTIEVNGCVNSTASNEPCSIEGYGSSAVYRILAGDNGVHQGYITIAHRNDIAKNPLRCNDASNSIEAWVPYGVSGYDWRSVRVANIPYSAPLMYGLEDKYSNPVLAYRLTVDGKPQDGIFLGAHNVTEWGIKYEQAEVGSFGNPYWFFRLLGPNSQDPQTGKELEEGESRTFIKINGS